MFPRCVWISFSVHPEFDALINTMVVIFRKLLKYSFGNEVHSCILRVFGVTFYDATRDAAGPEKPYFDSLRGVREKNERLFPSRVLGKLFWDRVLGKLFWDQEMTSHIPVTRKIKRRRRRRRRKRRSRGGEEKENLSVSVYISLSLSLSLIIWFRFHG